MSTQRPVPSERSDTMRPEEVHRKNFEEMLHSAFNKDQIAVLNTLMSGAGSVVDWNQKYDEGVNIADISIDGVTTPIYAPEGGGDQVQSDWNVSDSSSLAFIKNKPTIPAAQIQSDWDQTNSSARDYIKNKPTIPRVSRIYSGTFTFELDTFFNATSASDLFELPLFDKFVFSQSNYTVNTPSKFYLVFHTPFRPQTSSNPAVRNYLVCSRDRYTSSGIEYKVYIAGDESNQIGTLLLHNNISPACGIFFTNLNNISMYKQCLSGAFNLFNLRRPSGNVLSLGQYTVKDSSAATPEEHPINSFNDCDNCIAVLSVFYEM